MEIEKDIIEIKERLVKIEIILSTELDSLKKRTAKLEANQEWLIRTIIGAVVGAVMALIIAAK